MMVIVMDIGVGMMMAMAIVVGSGGFGYVCSEGRGERRLKESQTRVITRANC